MVSQTDARLVMDVINLYSKVQKRVGGALSIHGIGLSEYLVLDTLSSAPSQSMRRIDLAEKVGLSPSGVTRLLNPMEKIGLVSKEESPRDARVSLVVLSDAGMRVHRDATTSFEHASSALFDSLSSKRRATLSDWVRALAS